MLLNRPTFSRGFTLVELVLVLAIIALTFMLAAPELRNFVRGRSAMNTAGMFVATTHFARSQAITDATTYRVNIDVTNGRWWVTMNSATGYVEIDSAHGQSTSAADGVRIETDPGIKAADGMQYIEFDPSGRSDPAVVRFVGLQGVVEVVCETPLDQFHISAGDGR